MNEFCIEWVKGDDYAGVTVPSGTALKSKLMRYSENRPDEVRVMAVNTDGSAFFHIPISYLWYIQQLSKNAWKPALREHTRYKWYKKYKRKE